MSLLRWFGLVFVLLFQIAPSVVAAQEASSTPEADQPLPLSAVQREFEVAGMTLLGPAGLNAIVMVYETPEDAAVGFPTMMAYYREELERWGNAEFKQASAAEIGDERAAYAGAITSGDMDGQAGMFGWREGERLYILFAVGLAGDMLTPLFDLGDSLSGRPLPDTEIIPATSSDEMTIGGTYELLPTLEDMPPGWVFSEDTDMLATSDEATPEP